MNKIIAIYCAGSLGLDIASLLRRETNSELVFIDDVTDNNTVIDIPVYRFSEFTTRFAPETARIIIAIGEPRLRRMLREKVETAGYTLQSHVSPLSFSSEGVTVGDGTVVFPYVYLAPFTRVHENCIILSHVTIINGTQIGKDCFISGFVYIGDECHIGNEVFGGPSSSVKDCLTLGDHTVVGMGAVVLKSTCAGDVVVGNPARVLRNTIDEKVFKKNHYLIDGEEL